MPIISRAITVGYPHYITQWATMEDFRGIRGTDTYFLPAAFSAVDFHESLC